MSDFMCSTVVDIDSTGATYCGLPEDHEGTCIAYPVDVHLWFSLSYASYLVVNRSLLQSMPAEWQYRFTALMDELWHQFPDVKEPRYTVHVRDENGRFVRDPIPHYDRGRTFIAGVKPAHLI